jgi:hypothetical protein
VFKLGYVRPEVIRLGVCHCHDCKVYNLFRQ